MNRGIDKVWEDYTNFGLKSDRDKLVVHYAPMVNSIAGKISAGLPKNVETDDLVGYGIFGLIDAVTKFDPDRGFKFSTYATFRIKGAIVDGLRANDWVPRSIRVKSKAEGDYHVTRVDSVDSLVNEEGSMTLGDTIAEDFGYDHTFDQMCDLLVNGISLLTDREKVVLVAYYYENLTLADIGRILGVTESRVSQIHSKAMSFLREQFTPLGVS